MDEAKAGIGWGLLGCGDIAAKRVAGALRDAPGSALIAVARARAELAAEFARQHGARRWYADGRDLVRDPEIDAVYVATPVRLHVEHTVAAAEAGKHVLCEKPMALDVAGFEAFDPGPDHPRAWLLRRSESGGGPMMDFGCHRLEVLLDLLGPMAEVSGFPVNVRLKNREVEDTCLARLRFRSGAEAVLAVSHAVKESRDSVEIFGSAGSAHVPVLNQGRLRVVTAAGAREEEHPAPANLHEPLVADFVQAVRERRDPTVTGEIGAEVSRVLAAIYRS